MYIFLESLESPNFDLNWRNCRTDVLFGKPMEGNVKPGICKWRCLRCMCEGFKRFCISLFESVLILAPGPARDQWPVELHLSKFKILNSLWFEEMFLKLSSSINYIFTMEDMNSSSILNGITQVWYYFFHCVFFIRFFANTHDLFSLSGVILWKILNQKSTDLKMNEIILILQIKVFFSVLWA